MITFSFYKISEKKPKNGEEIILLEKHSSFEYETFEPRPVKVWYNYEEIGEDGLPTGNSWFEPYENCREVPYCGNNAIEDDAYWCSLDDYWASFDKDIPMENK